MNMKCCELKAMFSYLFFGLVSRTNHYNNFIIDASDFMYCL